MPIISRIPRCKAFKDTTAETMMSAPEAEAFRTLRTNLRYLNINRDLRSLLIASPEPSDGKSTVARGLAGAMVEMGDDVVPWSRLTCGRTAPSDLVPATFPAASRMSSQVRRWMAR